MGSISPLNIFEERLGSRHKLTFKYHGIQYASFLFAFLAIFWAGPIAQMYKLYYIAFAVCTAITVMLALAGKLKTGQVFRDGIPLFVFFVYLALSCMWARFPETTLLAVSIDSIYPVIFILAYIVALNNDLRRLTFIMFVIPFAVITFTIWAIFNFGVVRQEIYGEATQLGSSSSTLAIYLTASLPFLIWINYRKTTFFSIAAIIASIGLQFVFQSRAILAANMIGIVITWYSLASNKLGVLKSVFKAGLLLAVALIFLLVFDQGREFLQKSIERFQVGMDLSFLDAESAIRLPAIERIDLDRRLMWLTSYNSFVENTILGVGYMNIGRIFLENYGWYIVSHGIVTTLLGETGLIGTLLFSWVLLRYFRRISISIRIAQSGEEAEFQIVCRCSMLCLLFSGLFHQLLQDQLFYILLAWGSALNLRQQQAQN